MNKGGLMNKVIIQSGVVLSILLFCTRAHAQFSERIPAFDGTLHLSMSTTGKDNSASLTAGINGRRIPIGLTAGISYMEFDYTYQQLDLKKPCVWALNVTAMLRLAAIDWRSMDFNLYTTANRYDEHLFMEYGAKIGIMANVRTRLYAYAALRKGGYQTKQIEDAITFKSYSVMTYGMTIALLFRNGYDGYQFYDKTN
jgi:hypothetical protein